MGKVTRIDPTLTWIEDMIYGIDIKAKGFKDGWLVLGGCPDRNPQSDEPDKLTKPEVFSVLQHSILVNNHKTESNIDIMYYVI